jgi:hypothetical protein
MKDPDLIAEARKLELPIEPASGAEVEKMITSALAQPPETVAYLNEAAGGG